MREPILFGVPVTLLFLYFIWYSLLGWAMETTYCSLRQRHFVARGFLHGPICPIYGVGALLMVLALKPLISNLPLFFITATVTMSAWEYLVGWLLETTTHIKYWDYSDEPFNLQGRICLKNSLYWGIVSYIAIFWIHPQTVQLFAHLREQARWILSSALMATLLADTASTIRSLALTTAFLRKAEAAHLELERRRQELRQAGQQRLEEAALQAALLRLELRHTNLLEEAAHHSRRFRRQYTSMTSRRYHRSMQHILQAGEQLREHRAERIARLRAAAKAARNNSNRKDGTL